MANNWFEEAIIANIDKIRYDMNSHFGQDGYTGSLRVLPEQCRRGGAAL